MRNEMVRMDCMEYLLLCEKMCKYSNIPKKGNNPKKWQSDGSGNAGEVDAQELIGAGDHVDEEMFSLGTFFVHKQKDGIIGRSILKDDGHDLEQSFT